MRYTPIVLLSSCLALSHGPAAVVAAAAAPACQLKASHTIAHNDYARIYQRSGDTFGCLYSRNRRYKISGYRPRDDFGVAGQRNIRLAGRYVAFEDFLEGQDMRYTVVVFDLISGRQLHHVATGPTPPDTGVHGFAYGIGPTTTIQLRATGAVAWIASNRYTLQPQYEVRKRDTNSARGSNGDLGTKLLARGPNIAPASLRLHRTTLTWIDSGESRTAKLGS